MPPPLPSPTGGGSISRPTTSSARRTSVSVAQSKNATPKQSVGAGSGGLRSAKIRGSSDKENIGNTSGNISGSAGVGGRAARRGSTANMLATREKPPSKDGTVQRHAKEVEGLKDYVRVSPPHGR